ncbi:MAG: tetratricopeptide repeat protein, partial [Acidobacteria bacterium]|nr:tetratricopeptide repeat protein [Acidobacteriota bacterium]
ERLAAAARVRPDHPETHYLLGLMQYKRQEYGQAEAEFRAAIAGNQGRFEPRLGLARVLETSGRIPEARTAYEEAIRRNPSDPALLAEVGKMYFQSSQLPEARDWFERALGIDPGHRESLLQIGKLDKMENRYDAAQASFQRLVDADPADGLAWYYLGTVHLDREEYGEAEAALRRSVELEPRNPKAHYSLGQVLAALGRDAEAEREFDLHRRIMAQMPRIGPVARAEEEEE